MALRMFPLNGSLCLGARIQGAPDWCSLPVISPALKSDLCARFSLERSNVYSPQTGDQSNDATKVKLGELLSFLVLFQEYG